jgi:glycosyltransferase involved in cell wall biosynthesis
MKVVHIITGLHVGGAEMMLHKLLATMDRSQFEPTVISLIPGGECRALIEAEGVRVHDLDMKAGMPSVGQIKKLRQLARELRPDLVQGWMYHGNVIASLFVKFVSGNPRLLWNIRHSVADLGQEKRGTRLVIRLGALGSGRPDRIIYNSEVSQQQHAVLGYARDKAEMIPNGFDMDRFAPSPEAAARLRTELGLTDDALLVGVAARRHPMKGHENFLRAAARLKDDGTKCHFVLAGRGVDHNDPALRDLATGVLEGCVHLLGQRRDMPSFLAGLDLLCVPSLYGEGFPNVLGEAMASGVPCVATDVGESKNIVADTGRIVPPGDLEALIQALGEMLALGTESRSDFGRRCRMRIQENYSLEKIAGWYAELYRSI